MAKLYFLHESLRGVPVTSNEQLKQWAKEGLLIPIENVKNGSNITFKSIKLKTK